MLHGLTINNSISIKDTSVMGQYMKYLLVADASTYLLWTFSASAYSLV